MESDSDEKDIIRDNQIRSLYYIIYGYLHNPDASINNAAKVVMNVFNQFGLKIVDESFTRETSLIKSLLEDLAAPKVSTAAALLPGCPETIATLQVAEVNFEAARLAYDKEMNKEHHEDSASSLKPLILEVINDQLVVYLRAMQALNIEALATFTETVSKIIERNNTEVKMRINASSKSTTV